ncbi:MAG TPA: hypothetical protein VF868_10530 [Bacteroidia bacterium]|jgi:hypothetical protein
MKKLLCLIVLAVSLFGCRKETLHKVIYKVIVTAGTPTYSVKYSSAENSTQTAGPLTASKWVSPEINDRKSGNVVSLTLEGGSGGSYMMYIYVNGRLHAEERMDDPYGPKTLSVKLPDED